MHKYHSGQLRERGTVDALGYESAGGGSKTEVWSPLRIDVPLDIHPMTQSEIRFAQRIEHPVTHGVVARYDTVYKPDIVRIRWYDRSGIYHVLRLRSVIDVDARGRWLEMLAEEIRLAD